MALLTLLDGVSWGDATIIPGRTSALLAALTMAHPDGASDSALIDVLWEDDVPASAKALQVVVARARKATSAELIQRTAAGYRLNGEAGHVDALLIRQSAAAARAALASGDAAHAVALAQSITAQAVGETSDPGPLGELRRETAELQNAMGKVLGQALSRIGEHEQALPLLRSAALAERDDVLMGDLLRSESALRGPAAALDTFEAYRSELADRLGVDPSPALRTIQAELLAADRPVRTGVQFLATDLIGREDDLHRLRSLLSSARVVSIVGPGGIGKTTLAQTLAREASEPVVHVVELASADSSADVTAAVGSAVGVRGSVTDHRVHGRSAVADNASRIAEQLGDAPTLLVLDNCEHLISSVADLVAFLVASTPSVRLLTTSRAPLDVPGEHVYALDSLSIEDGVRLFTERARAARLGFVPDDAAAREIVERLDGLPLAIELAAARARVLSASDIAQRLTDRFVLLRGVSRGTEDRHQTLLAVIDWSWNLLSPAEQRGLARLSVFTDSISLDAAESVLGPDALDDVTSLVNQSLLAVVDDAGGLRYRMLETVREFGRMQLTTAAKTQDARHAMRDWALSLVQEHGPQLHDTRQVAALDRLWPEVGNLYEVLRLAIDEDDLTTTIRVGSTLCSLWILTGERAEVGALGAIWSAVKDHQIPAEIADPARDVLSDILLISGLYFRQPSAELLAKLASLGAGTDPRISAKVTVFFALMSPDGVPNFQSIPALSESSNPRIAGLALQWLTFLRENEGDRRGAIDAGQAYLAGWAPEHGLSQVATMQSLLAGLYLSIGELDQAEDMARKAIAINGQLHARDDELEGRAVLAIIDLRRGKLDEAEQSVRSYLGRVGHQGGRTARLLLHFVSAELQLARGDRSAAIAQLVAFAKENEALPPIGVGDRTAEIQPWTIVALAVASTAQARFADDPRDAADGCRRLAGIASDILTSEHADLPVAGIAIFAVAAWRIYAEADASDAVLKLLVTADAFGCDKSLPIMDWDTAWRRAHALRPESADRVAHELAGTSAQQLRESAIAELAQFTGR